MSRSDTGKEPPLTSPAEVRAPIDVLLEWHEGSGIPDDWDHTVAGWPEGAPDEPGGELHHVRAVHEGCTVGIHVVAVRSAGRLHGVWCAVDPAFRGRGVAQRLLARHLAWARDHDRGPLKAHVPATDGAMLVACLKAGLALAGTYTDGDGRAFAILEATG